MLVISSPFNFYAYFIYSLHSLKSQKDWDSIIDQYSVLIFLLLIKLFFFYLFLEIIWFLKITSDYLIFKSSNILNSLLLIEGWASLDKTPS